MSNSGEDTAARPGSAPSPFANGAAIGVGSLPHRDASAAAAFAIGEFDIATIPSLPKRSPAETMIAQAVVGLPGVSLGQYGSIAVDATRTTDDAPIVTDLAHDAFAGVRSFLELAAKVRLDGARVKWQFVGPVTLGVALQRAGLPSDAAFSIAVKAVRSHLGDLSAAISDVLPRSPQLVLLDEPWLDQLMTPDFPIPPDEAIDLMSSGMATLTPAATVGIHCCTMPDVATMLAAGPGVISIPVSDDLVDWAGYITRFLDEGGVIAWGAVPTDGPLGASAERHWRALSDLWCSLVQRGCDPVTLRRQSLITPTCGLATHSVSVARRVARQTGEVAKRVKDQAGATRFALGA
jgi:hypothetical protein